MSMMKKFAEYAIEEIEMAEKYIELASKIEDASVCEKLKEIAKDEIRHCGYLQKTLAEFSEIAEVTGENPEKDINKAFRHAHDDWKKNVEYKIAIFVPKK